MFAAQTNRLVLIAMICKTLAKIHSNGAYEMGLTNAEIFVYASTKIWIVYRTFLCGNQMAASKKRTCSTRSFCFVIDCVVGIGH